MHPQKVTSHQCAWTVPLPTEIILHIFELAARTSQEDARSLCMVASWVLPVARPALYESCHLTSSRGLNRLCAALGLPHYDGPEARMLSLLKILPEKRARNSKATAQPRLWLDEKGGIGRRVRHLLVPARLKYTEKDRVESVIKTCKELSDLAIPSSLLDGLYRAIIQLGRERGESEPYEQADQKATVPRSGPPLPITRLTLLTATMRYDWDPFARARIGRAFLQNLTHLCITEQDNSIYLPFSHLTNLTHLSLPLTMNRQRCLEADTVEALARTVEKEAFAIRCKNTKSVKLQMIVFHVEYEKLSAHWLRGQLSSKNFLHALVTIISEGSGSDELYLLPIINKRRRLGSCRAWGSIWEHGARGGPNLWDLARAIRLRAQEELERIEQTREDWFPLGALLSDSSMKITP